MKKPGQQRCVSRRGLLALLFTTFLCVTKGFTSTTSSWKPLSSFGAAGNDGNDSSTSKWAAGRNKDGDSNNNKPSRPRRKWKGGGRWEDGSRGPASQAHNNRRGHARRKIGSIRQRQTSKRPQSPEAQWAERVASADTYESGLTILYDMKQSGRSLEEMHYTAFFKLCNKFDVVVHTWTRHSILTLFAERPMLPPPL